MCGFGMLLCSEHNLNSECEYIYIYVNTGLCFWGTSTSRPRSSTLVKQTPETYPETDPSFCLSS